MTDTWTVLTLEKEPLALKLLPCIGGRLWDIEFHGQSLLFQNPDLIGLPVDPMNLAGLPSRSPQFSFPLWGGEKTWIAPDTEWVDNAPFATLDSGAYRVDAQTPGQVTMISEICPVTDLQIKRIVSLTSSSMWSIEHRIVNNGTTTRRIGAWSVMMIQHPATIAVITDGLPAKPVFGAAGDSVHNNGDAVTCSCSGMAEFKIGLPNPENLVLIRSASKGLWLACVTAPHDPDSGFAHSHPLEVFNSGEYGYCEAEWHSPANSLAPGSTLGFKQDFHIWLDDHPPDEIYLHGSARELMACMC